MSGITQQQIEQARQIGILAYPDVVDIHQLCEMLGGIGIKTAYKLLQNNEIAHLKVGRAYRIPKCHVIAYLQKCGDSVAGSTNSLV